jgi:hypothetical protein
MAGLDEHGNGHLIPIIKCNFLYRHLTIYQGGRYLVNPTICSVLTGLI